ncbi:hypothetical protein DH2020_010548 [Rehmannia glutinosa]|uniref:UBN2_2 domain-containing protein n=1 Tax=Rehmannia glutinosa TaxID=99300 RepID=A0ABR0XAV8_REHGL
MVSGSKVAAPTHGEKPAKFSGGDFQRWQQKMLFYVTTLGLSRFLKEDPPAVGDEESDNERRIAVDAWHNSDFLCRNYVLNGLDDTLYNVYSSFKTSKELWDSLEKKYKTEDAGAKKFVVGKFLDYKMVDTKTVISQVQEIQIILHDLVSEEMILNESFQVVAIIEKLPPPWKDFKNYLKHKRKEMGLEDLIVRLRIEEDNRDSEWKSANVGV